MINYGLILAALAASSCAGAATVPALQKRADDGIINIPSPVNHTGNVDACAGYKLTSVDESDHGVDGVLELIGECNAYGPDYPKLTLTVRYETEDRVRVHIADADGKAHVVPSDVANWPKIGDCSINADRAALKFDYTAEPFSFKVTRKCDGEVLFDTTGQALIFEEQYLRVKSKLADGSNLQGLAQHNDNFTLPIDKPDYVRTFWNRDAYGVPTYTNLYGTHPFYVNQKVGEKPSASGTFLLNSEGMDVKFPEGGKYIEYNAIGGIADFFFFNGPTPDKVAMQASEVWGPSKEVPYWSLGFHSCRYGYIDIAEVAEVVANYSAAGIPLQTQWMDIDYMYNRWIQTLDPDRFALEKVSYVVQKLHSLNQDFIVMVDPATFSGTPNMSVANYETFQSGMKENVFLHYPNGDVYEGVVWPGPTAFPDWTAPNAQAWWTAEFARFFNEQNGVDVDGIWLDMNEPANFLPYLEANIYRISLERESPPARPLPRIIPRNIPGFPEFVAGHNISEPFGSGSASNATARRDLSSHEKRQNLNRTFPTTMGDYLSPGLDNQWLYPPYRIDDRRAPPSAANDNSGTKNISDFTARTDLVQANGARMYDEHNLYGSRHAIVTRNALMDRRPGKRPFTVARSSFSGTPSALWLGDNQSTWEQYIQTIRQMLQFAAISGVGVVGADTCGFGQDTTEKLCARWAWLGAFNTFYRNHNQDNAIGQEFYRWPLTAAAGKAAGRWRLRLLDYTYTAVQRHSATGAPTLWPLSWVHPTEPETVHIESQFYFGPSLLINPVTDENSTSVTFHMPNDLFYDLFTLKATQGEGKPVTLTDVAFDQIPAYIRSGSIIPLRTGESMTTYENRKLPFQLVVAPAADNTASGELYLDDGESIDVGHNYSDVWFNYDNCKLCIGGRFGYRDPEVTKLDSVVFAGQDCEKKVYVNGEQWEDVCFDKDAGTITVNNLGLLLDCEAEISLA